MSDRPEFEGWDAAIHDVHAHWQKFVRSEWAWLVQTFYELEQSGLPISASAQPQAAKINIIHADDYLALKNKTHYFAAVVIADRRVFFPGDCLLVQNRKQVSGGTSHCIPHWDQPGLIPRVGQNNSSGESFSVAFAGIPANTVRLEALLAREPFDQPVCFSVLEPDKWNDFSQVDALVAIRDFKGRRHPEKPPTKLFNAWCAGVPFIGGMDCAYEQVGQPGFNYLQVATRQQLVEAIAKLQDPAVWQSMVQEGAKAAQQYGRDNTRNTWIYLLSGPLQEQFRRWERTTMIRRRFSLWVHWLRFNVMRMQRRYWMWRGQY